MNLISIFRRYPLFGLVACLALLIFLTGPKVFAGLQDSEYIPGGNIYETEILDTKVEKVNRRHNSQDCFVLVQIEQRDRDARVECGEMAKVSIGDKIKVIDSDGYLSSQDFRQGHLTIDLFLVVAEIFGVFACGIGFTRRLRLRHVQI